MNPSDPLHPSVDGAPLTIQELLNSAVQHHNQGRLPEAESIYQKILLSDPNQPIALHLLGVISHQAGKNEIAIELISKAIHIKPDFSEAHNNLGTVQKALGRIDDAMESYRRALSFKPEYADAHYNLGLICFDAGHIQDAEVCYQHVLEYRPNDVNVHVKLGHVFRRLDQLSNAAESFQKALNIEPNSVDVSITLAHILIELGDQQGAANLFRKVLTLQPENANIAFNLAKVLHDLGQIDASIETYQRGLNIAPKTAEALCNLGIILQATGRVDEALKCYQDALTSNSNLLEGHYNLGLLYQEQNSLNEAISSYRNVLSINPEFTNALNNLGVIFKEIGGLDEAVLYFKKVVLIDPSNGDAYDNLCEISEKTNDTDVLRWAVGQAKLNCIMDTRIAYREAQLFKLDGDYAAARTVLENRDDIKNHPRFNAAKAQVLGDLCDRLGDTGAAYKYFEQCNTWRKTVPGAEKASKERYLSRIASLSDQYTPEWVASWQPIQADHDRPDPVFLVGFPRSGTTLLDTILMSHADIAVLEEGPAVHRMQSLAKALLTPYPDNLIHITDENLAEIRKAYFLAIEDQDINIKGAKIVIDKMPLNLIEAGFIHRIFPNARFIFAQRHPCDCVLSCFMQDFELNDSMASFLDLESSAYLYDKVMSIWSQYQAVMPLRVHKIRYESLVQAFDQTLNPVLEFLDLDWDDGMNDYADTARKRKLISTPSYNQVTQPLYTRARNRWKRYGPQMEAILPILRPWIKEYGYDE